LQSLQKSLSRHFDVLLDESHLWSSYNEYAIRSSDQQPKQTLFPLTSPFHIFRLEMLGHSIALLLKQQTVTAKTEAKVKTESPETTEMPTIAIIAPATSKGIPPNRLDRLALIKSLIPSLYKTRSRYLFTPLDKDPRPSLSLSSPFPSTSGFNYRVYLSVNENDPIFSNEVITTALFDSLYAIQKEEFTQELLKKNSSERVPNDTFFPMISHK
jgi:hypothetical protein